MTIDETLDAFLADRKQRLAVRTYRNYEVAIWSMIPGSRSDP